MTEFVVGDRVGIAWLHSACGSCEYCCSGWETLCLNQRTTGYSVPGCMSEYVLAVAKYAVKIPAGLSDEQAARKIYYHAFLLFSIVTFFYSHAQFLIIFLIKYVDIQLLCVPA